jgi:hypothetical protein
LVYEYVPQKSWLALNGLHGVISQKMVLFITTAVRTSNPTTRFIIETFSSLEMSFFGLLDWIKCIVSV